MQKELLMNTARLVIMLMLVSSCFGLQAKSNCSSYEAKLKKIQSKQRQGYSAAQGVKLAKQERAAYSKWWDCKRGKLKTKSKKAKGAKQSVQRSKLRTPSVKPYVIKSLTNTVSIKAKYQGAKQQKWLDYYQPQAECKSPKKLSTFAKCMKDEQRQQALFEQQ